MTSDALSRGIERVTFYDELSRRRRRVWLSSGICLLIASGVGLVLSSIVTPVLLVILAGVLRAASALGLLAPGARAGIEAIHAFARGQMDHFQQILDSLDRIHGLNDMPLLTAPLVQMAPVVGPALLAGAITWLWLRHIFLRAGGQDLIVRMKARPANLDDAEERQLNNIVQEIAIGAGSPPPRLFLIDAPQINAAALGTGPQDSVIVVCRGLLLGLDRSETEAVVARLISSIGAGDLKLAAGVLAVFQTFGFFLTVLDLPLRWSAWRTLGALGLVSILPGKTAAMVGRVGEGLEASLEARTTPDPEVILAKVPPQLRKVAQIALIPWLPALLISLLYKLVLFLWTAIFLGPPMAMLWRNRCFETDALGVKLGRAPEAFARALEKIGAPDLPEGGQAYAYLFIGAPAAARRAASDRRSMTLALAPASAERIGRLMAMGDGVRRARRPSDLSELSQNPLRTAAATALLLLLAPLVAMLIFMIGYITALVMTIGLAAGLGLVLWVT